MPWRKKAKREELTHSNCRSKTLKADRGPYILGRNVVSHLVGRYRYDWTRRLGAVQSSWRRGAWTVPSAWVSRKNVSGLCGPRQPRQHLPLNTTVTRYSQPVTPILPPWQKYPSRRSRSPENPRSPPDAPFHLTSNSRDRDRMLSHYYTTPRLHRRNNGKKYGQNARGLRICRDYQTKN